MSISADRGQENKNEPVSNTFSKKTAHEPTVQLVDNRPEAAAHSKLQEMANNSSQAKGVRQLRGIVDNRPEAATHRKLQEMANNSSYGKQVAQLQALADNRAASQSLSAQRKENNSNLPDNLKNGIENLSGYSMGDVRVHYNSNKPAQIQAQAYAQGANIYLGPGQEKHLPHEAWHVVQQKQGRVTPTLQTNEGVKINQDAGLEREADVMGDKALQSNIASAMSQNRGSELEARTIGDTMIQRKVGFEFQAFNSVTIHDPMASISGVGGMRTDVGVNLGQFKVQGDSGAKYMHDGEKYSFIEMEIITQSVEETEGGRDELSTQMDNVVALATSIDMGKTLEELGGGVEWIEHFKKYITLVHGARVHFHPQATVGIKFDKIADLIGALTKSPYRTGGEESRKGWGKNLPSFRKKQPSEIEEEANKIGWSGKKDQRPFKKGWAKGLQKARKVMGGDNVSENAIGFAAILFSLAEVSKKGHKVDDANQPRYFTPLFFRTTLVPFYQSLSEGEKELIDNRLSNKVKNTKAIPTEETTTIGQLLEGLKEGNYIDLFQNMGRVPTMQTYGLHHMSDIGGSDAEAREDRQGALIELRKLGNDVPADKLKDFALAVFDLVKLLNTPPNPEDML